MHARASIEGTGAYGDLERQIDVVPDMTRSRLTCFHKYQPTLGSFVDLFAGLRGERFIWA
jgi:hypothetical protein